MHDSFDNVCTHAIAPKEGALPLPNVVVYNGAHRAAVSHTYRPLCDAQKRLSQQCCRSGSQWENIRLMRAQCAGQPCEYVCTEGSAIGYNISLFHILGVLAVCTCSLFSSYFRPLYALTCR